MFTKLIGGIVKSNLPGIVEELKKELPKLIEEYKDKIPEYIDMAKAWALAQLNTVDSDKSGKADALEYGEDFDEAGGHLAALFNIAQRVAKRAQANKEQFFPSEAKDAKDPA